MSSGISAGASTTVARVIPSSSSANVRAPVRGGFRWPPAPEQTGRRQRASTQNTRAGEHPDGNRVRSASTRLRRRLQNEHVRNVTVIKGAPDDPRLPERTLDAALIVNAYHEMPQYQSILAALRRALKPDGRLVIVEPVSESKRGRPRADQIRDHEIDPEYVIQDARAAGFRVVGLQDPFTIRSTTLEWLITLQPRETPVVTASAPERNEADGGELADPALRISVEEFTRLVSTGTVAIVDVRDVESYAAGHIPGAMSVPLDTVEDVVERLRALNKPVVTYCS